MDYAKANSTFVVRVEYDGYNTDKKYGAISWNGGYSWSPFNSNGTAALNTNDDKGGGNIAVNANNSANSSNSPCDSIYSNPRRHTNNTDTSDTPLWSRS